MAERDELLEHNYDGIQEYDNDLPRWWLGIFVLTTIFAVGYIFYTHSGMFESQKERLARRLAEIEALKSAKQKSSSSAAITEQALLALTKDKNALEEGKTIFAQKCAACHGQHGEGLIGPNLTDDYWLHGGKITDLVKVVTNGVLEKGMLAWKGVLKEDQINNVVAYIWTLHGTNPTNAKAPQGKLVPRD
ncbi:MAG: cytochrome oxidase subunit III [Candidatus Dadabacteria bacterium]|nr:MAG: cytochrome oxidase subunit III [Candidatus Dadabacteria bacterium]